MPQAAKRFAFRNYCLSDYLHRAVRRRSRRVARDDEVQHVYIGRGGRGARSLCSATAWRASRLPLDHPDWRPDGHDLFAPRLSVWTGANLVRNVARRPSTETLFGCAPEIPDAALVYLDRVFCSRDTRGLSGYRGCG